MGSSPGTANQSRPITVRACHAIFLVMAHSTLMVLVSTLLPLAHSLQTCPGIPGFCSESFPGQTCNVVCDFGRNNVPLCQDDGTWTDIPRCVEHDPGVEEQIPGLCPGIPGYCAIGFLNQRCSFDCVSGADIDSLCTTDGTWAPYPTCEGDLRETRDGCDGCPGPAGGSRNRTAEAILNSNIISDRRVPKVIGNDGGRKNIPSFAGNINIGRINTPTKSPSQARPSPRLTPAPRRTPAPTVPRTTPAPRPAPARRPTPAPRPRQNIQNFQTNFDPRAQQQFAEQPRRQPQPSFAQQPQQQFAQPPRQKFAQQPQRQFAQQPQRQFAQQPQQQFAQQPLRQPQQSFNPGLNRFQPGSEASQPLSLFDQIKNKINQGNAQQARQQQPQPVQQPQFQPQPQPSFQQPQQSFQQPQQTFQPQQSFQPQQQPGQNFGVFEAVSLGDRTGGPSPPEGGKRQRSQPPADGFFGVFPEANLQS